MSGTLTEDTDTGAVRSAEARRYRAMADADVVTLTQLCSPRLVYVHSTGHRDDKASYLDKMASGVFRYDRIEHTEEHVEVLGGVAMVVGTMTASGRANGQAVTLSSRVLAVWAREEQQWRLVAVQSTRMPA